ncbi:MAG TPA: tetratricopeptide repeat protein [Rhizomicrobium sp.]|jgi:Flp pilus assembly protein TadD|nr:tetratricopeptide repeat protein [Rhizomicrobium sp.]
MRSVLFALSVAALSVAGASPQPNPAKNLVPRPPSELEALFGQLAKATSPDEARPIEEKILTLFLESGSASVDLLMTRAAAALADGDSDTARKILGVVTQVAPNYAEGWHQRGRLQAVAGDDEGAIVSLQKAVTLNPRQFAALAELGAILSEYGDKRDALTILRKAITLDRHFVGLDQEVQKLSRDVEGERI